MPPEIKIRVILDDGEAVSGLERLKDRGRGGGGGGAAGGRKGGESGESIAKGTFLGTLAKQLQSQAFSTGANIRQFSIG